MFHTLTYVCLCHCSTRVGRSRTMSPRSTARRSTSPRRRPRCRGSPRPAGGGQTCPSQAVGAAAARGTVWVPASVGSGAAHGEEGWQEVGCSVSLDQHVAARHAHHQLWVLVRRGPLGPLHLGGPHTGRKAGKGWVAARREWAAALRAGGATRDEVRGAARHLAGSAETGGPQAWQLTTMTHNFDVRAR
jgi:hypothetical protein